MGELLVARSSQGGEIENLLAALGARFAAAPLEEIVTRGKGDFSGVLLSEHQFGELCKDKRAPDSVKQALTGFENIFIYPFRGTPEGLSALQNFAGGTISVKSPGATVDYRIAENRTVCGPFAGLRVEEVESGKDTALAIEGAVARVESLVNSDAGSLVTRFSLPGISVFVVSSEAVFDVAEEHLLNLDVRKCFSGLVPLLFLLRHSRIDLPATPSRWAHWIIDDPNLRRRYGFLDLRGFARSVRETGAAASIAFIPWNHRRTSREIVELFRNNWPQLSICIHGCDHTGSEFSTRTMTEATPLIDLAMRRMKLLEAETSLGCDQVMVFPQGRFSREAMRALRESEMLAAANTELLDCQTGRGVKGGELLKPAILSLGGFPLFMRRPAEEAPANFALDLILQKPCLIVSHHQYFEHGLDSFRSAVERLNALEPGMTWTNLEAGIRSTYSVSTGMDNRPHVRLYSARTTFAPQTGEPVVVTRSETDPKTVKIFVDGNETSSTAVNGDIQFVVKSATRTPMTIEARTTAAARPADAQNLKYRLKVTTRRYLSEVRDNYLCRFPVLNAGAASMRRLLHKP